MRVFVAIDLPENVRSELTALQRSLVVGRLVPVDNLHLTLSFLGEQRDEAVEDAHQALSELHAPAFDLRLASVGIFGKRAPHVVFADVAPCDQLFDLERRINRALRHAGLEFEKRRFRPHVTITRLPKFVSAFDLGQVRDYLDAQASFRGSSFAVTRFQLYQSTLRPEGAVHDSLASYELVNA